MLGTFTPESLKNFAEANGFDTENADFSEGVFDFKVCSTPKGETYGIPDSSKCASPNREISSKDKKGGFLGIGQNTDVRHLPFKTDPGKAQVLQRAEDFFKTFQRRVKLESSSVGRTRALNDAEKALKTIDTMKKWSEVPLTQGQARILAQAYRDVKIGVENSSFSFFSKERKEKVISAFKLAQSRLNDAKMTAEEAEAVPRKSKEREARAKFDALSPAEKKKYYQRKAAEKEREAAEKAKENQRKIDEQRRRNENELIRWDLEKNGFEILPDGTNDMPDLCKKKKASPSDCRQALDMLWERQQYDSSRRFDGLRRLE
jgi:hypothetical protein